MKFRMTLTVEGEAPPEKWLEKYGTTEPYTLARAIQARGMERMKEEGGLDHDGNPVTIIGFDVTPVYG